MQVGKKCNGASLSAQGACKSRKTRMSSNRSSGAADNCGALERRILRIGCDVLGDIKNLAIQLDR
jgi:hypothetical protein